MVLEKKILSVSLYKSMGANDPRDVAGMGPIISLWELYMGMAAIFIYGPWPSVHIFNPSPRPAPPPPPPPPPLTQGSTWSLKKFGLGVSEERSFKGVNGRTDWLTTDGK